MIALALFASSLFHFDTAKALYRAEQYENALKQLDTSEQLREPAPLRPLYRGKCLAQLGKWQDVQAVLEPFLATHPDNADGWYWLGASQYYAHRLDQSLVSLDKAFRNLLN
ncbi:MAG: hypothetical protein H7039_05195 [Bryobacteraceae bacterium]|nr:hypothetical protein [Bryobacteraceae bacterium]